MQTKKVSAKVLMRWDVWCDFIKKHDLKIFKGQRGTHNYVHNEIDGEQYPRIHFICEKVNDIILVTCHRDIQPHFTLPSSAVMEWEKRLNDFIIENTPDETNDR